MDALRRHIAPLVAALMIAATAVVPLAHRWLHHGVDVRHAGAVELTTGDTHCDLCAAPLAAPPAPTPPLAVRFVADAPAPVLVFDTGVARLLEAIGRAPPVG